MSKDMRLQNGIKAAKEVIFDDFAKRDDEFLMRLDNYHQTNISEWTAKIYDGQNHLVHHFIVFLDKDGTSVLEASYQGSEGA